MSQLLEIVNLAIEGQYVTVASVHHRLVAARAEINNAEPIVTDSKTSGCVNDFSSVIWPAMGHRSHHPIKRRLIQSSLGIYQPAAYRTHLVKQPFETRRALCLSRGVDRNPFFHPAISGGPVHLSV